MKCVDSVHQQDTGVKGDERGGGATWVTMKRTNMSSNIGEP